MWFQSWYKKRLARKESRRRRREVMSDKKFYCTACGKRCAKENSADIPTCSESCGVNFGQKLSTLYLLHDKRIIPDRSVFMQFRDGCFDSYCIWCGYRFERSIHQLDPNYGKVWLEKICPECGGTNKF